MWKMGACIALSAAMMLTSTGGMLPSDWGIETVYADETQTTTKTFTANQLTKAFAGGADGTSCELGKEGWDVELKHNAEQGYPQAVWNLSESFDLANVESVAFNVESQEGDISLKLGMTTASGWYDDVEVLYGQNGQKQYAIVPEKTEGTFDKVAIMTTKNDASFCLTSVVVTLKEGSGSQITYGDNIIDNGDFSKQDFSSWSASLGGAKITAESIEDGADIGVTTCGAITRSKDRSKSYECFAQDITENVSEGQEYEFSFWAKLSDDYKDSEDQKLKDSQKTVQFQPYYVNGNDKEEYDTTGLISGTSAQVLEVGKWTKFEGTYKIPSGAKKVVIRILEQGDWQEAGSCIMGKYYVANVSMRKITKPKPEIEKDIHDWKASVTKSLGNGSIAGTAIMLSEITDDTLMELVEKHFNAVTFGNELKPDALFNYQLDSSIKTDKINFNGSELEVPVVNEKGGNLDFSRADAMADKILEWNNAHPDQKIRIRGHVLVWHSQTQEWFFHENYDITKPYVNKETMNRRLEWFISSVFDHYFGEAANGKYDGLFYGWDVVNEAVIGNTYRTDKVSAAESLSEIRHGNNSSWWHVYESNEFIINAFKYANKYAPANVELYYNDFGETDNTKCEGIVKLINDVKSAEGTRLDAFGMQAHYNVDGFSAAQFKSVAKKYAQAAGKVQLTELDFKASSTYDGTAATKESEYTKMAYCHKNLYEAIKALKAEGANVSGITVWGVIEPNSWLHSQSNLGGGASGSAQCPLLFDGNYKAKPAYWAYVDASKLQPAIQKVTITEAKDGNIAGETYTIDQGAVQAEFIPVWDADGLTVQVKVKDTTVNDADAVTVYVDPDNSASDITPHKVTVARTAAAAIAGGYQATVKVSMKGLKVAQQISLDVVVNNDGETGSFNDLTGKQESSSKYYAVATMKPGIEKIPYGTISVDADADAAWGNAVNIPLTINKGSEASANAKVLWDDDNLYVYATVKDAVLDKTGAQTHEQDSLEVFIDEDNGKTASYGEDDKQYRINYNNEQSFNGKKCLAENVKSATKTIDGGYVVEAAFKWTDIKPVNGTKIGLELQINDAKDGKRIGTLSWYDETGMGWSGSNVYGTVELTGKTGSNGGGSSVNPGISDTKPDVKPDGKQDATIETKPDESTVETSKVEITVSGGKKAEASVTITKDAQGNVTSANATVSGSKGTLTADVVKQLIEAAGTEDLTIIVQVKNANGDVKYTVSVSAENVKHNKSLKAFVVNRKTGEYELINSKTYKAEDGNLNVSFGKKGDYVLLTTKEAARIEKEILKTIAPKK
uniref:endo-1,4-beta-xylanase n=1 Tax=uncultured Eubacterium sp. TaxID=165185 RepID=UPI0032663AED